MAAVGPTHRSRVSMSLQGGAVTQSASGTVLGTFSPHNILLITHFSLNFIQQLQQHLSINHPIFLKMFNLIDRLDMEHSVLFGKFHFFTTISSHIWLAFFIKYFSIVNLIKISRVNNSIRR